MHPQATQGRRHFLSAVARQVAATGLVAFGVQQACRRRRLSEAGGGASATSCEACFLASMCGRENAGLENPGRADSAGDAPPPPPR